jgi:hypothetical protein
MSKDKLLKFDRFAKNKYQKQVLAQAPSGGVLYLPDLGRVLNSVKAGLFLSQLLYWYDKGRDPDWIYKTINETKNELGLSRKEQATAIRQCVNVGFITVKRKGVPAKRHFKLDFPAIVKAVQNMPH